MQESCHNCQYLRKSPGIRQGIKFYCRYWGLTTFNTLPQSVVIQSIGKKCPFYRARPAPPGRGSEQKGKEKGAPGDDGLNIVI